MSLTQDNGMYMPVQPMMGGYGGSNGGFMNDGAWWIIILFLFAFNGGWGRNNGYGGGSGGSEVQSGFDHQAVMGGVNGLNSAVANGFANVNTALCNGFAGVNSTVANGFANAESSAAARQMANMQQAFAAQTAMNAGMNNLATQFANCCCENRLAVANLGATIAAENCADRAAVTDGVRDLLANQNAGIQRILDQMCNDKIDAKNEKIADLERQLTAANLAASQTAQTAQLLRDNAAQTAALEQYLNPAPIPAYVVQNPNCCNGFYNGCGCGN